uniref:Serpin peptidase inhibitor, clade B (ovalbumin), member 1, like 3 n=1 Tax=Labrus bergylta TaxID=56723 RepID=A0A3Q3NQF4_9LABR
MASTSPPFSLAKANSTFSLDLFKKLSDDDKTANIFYSPLSISSALAMVMLGARANTAAQMSECLKPQNGDDEVHAKFGELLSELNKEDAPYALSVANRLYGEKSYRFNKVYTKKHYSAELKSVDFKKKAEEARVHINDWVEKNTQGKIKDLLAEGAVDDSTRLALINAVYFKGTWDQQFKEQDTVEYQFRVNKVTEEQLSFALYFRSWHLCSWMYIFCFIVFIIVYLFIFLVIRKCKEVSLSVGYMTRRTSFINVLI